MRAREAAEKIKESIPDVEARALAQKTTPEQVKQAQEALKKVHEYLGEANGKLDAVTVNSIEAFQRAHGLKADGILNEKNAARLAGSGRQSGLIACRYRLWSVLRESQGGGASSESSLAN